MDDVMRKAFQRWFNSRSIRHFDTALEAGWNAALRDLERGKEPVATVVDQLCDLALRGLERGAEPVVWTRQRTINDPNGCPIGMDEPETKYQRERPDGHDWLPLYASAPPAASAEPVAWRFYADGQWFTGSTREACHKMLTNAGINAEIHPLYASAPPAVGGTVQVPRLVATAPERIYLGVFDDAGVEQQDFPEDHEGITWCTDNVGHADVEYIRADLAAAPGAK